MVCSSREMVTVTVKVNDWFDLFVCLKTNQSVQVLRIVFELVDLANAKECVCMDTTLSCKHMEKCLLIF